MQINKDQFSLSSWRENARFHYYRGQGHLPRYLLNRLRWHVYPRLHIVTRYPEHVDMELSAVCNMRCPMCYTITDDFRQRVKRGLMDGALWRKIVDEAATGGVFSLRLSLRGEPTLHPEFVAAAHYAKRRGIKEVASLTNALALTPEMFEQLVEAGLDWLTISVDGVGQTYERIRWPARFDDLLGKLRAFQAIKRRRRRHKPVVKVQSVWPAIQDDPQQYYQTLRPWVDQIACNPLVDYLGRDTAAGLVEYQRNFDCHVLYQRLAVGADGKVLFCIYDEFGDDYIGDLNRQTIHEIWHGAALTVARAAHRQHRGVAVYRSCARCPNARQTEVITTARVGTRPIAVNALTARVQELGR
jgi:hypothetical protein